MHRVLAAQVESARLLVIHDELSAMMSFWRIVLHVCYGSAGVGAPAASDGVIVLIE